jgi:hypothetical protein
MFRVLGSGLVFKVAGFGALRTINQWAEFGVGTGGDIGRHVPRTGALGHGVLSQHDSGSVSVCVCVCVCMCVCVCVVC